MEPRTLIAFQGKEWFVRAYSTYNGDPAYWIERKDTGDTLIVEAATIHEHCKVLRQPS